MVNVCYHSALAAPSISSISCPASSDVVLFGGDDLNMEYSLPFTFPFFGRNIVNININTNGLIELLESGESCYECDDIETHCDGEHIANDIDAIFAANDDLETGVMVTETANSVEITWGGVTYDDAEAYGYADYEILFKVTLFSDGRVQWHFMDMNYDSYCDLFSGVYDEVGDTEYEVPGGSTSFQGDNVNTCFEFDPDINTASIPTMTEWGMIIFSLIIGSVAIWFIRKQSYEGSVT
jgi:hypothetical protein